MFATMAMREAAEFAERTLHLPPEVVKRTRELSRTTALGWRDALSEALREYVAKPRA